LPKDIGDFAVRAAANIAKCITAQTEVRCAALFLGTYEDSGIWYPECFGQGTREI
jgi:hypothetical protein